MSKVSALILSFLVTMGVCLLGCSAATQTSKSNIPLTSIDMPMPAIVAEQAPSPGHILIEPEKMLSYQLRHRYTLICDDLRFGIIDYRRQPLHINATLLSGQHIVLPPTCEVKIGQPTKAIYVYHRVVQLE